MTTKKTTKTILFHFSLAFNQLKANNEIQRIVADGTSKMVVQVVKVNQNTVHSNAGVHLNRVQLMEFCQSAKEEDQMCYDHLLQAHANGNAVARPVARAIVFEDDRQEDCNFLEEDAFLQDNNDDQNQVAAAMPKGGPTPHR